MLQLGPIIGGTNKYRTALTLTSVKETLVAGFYDW